MSNLIERTPLTPDELAFQCLALTHAALFSDEPAVKESLLFVLLEKVDALYDMLPEICPACSTQPAVGDFYTQNDCGMTAIVRTISDGRVVFSYEQYPEARHDYPLDGFIRGFTRQEVHHA